MDSALFIRDSISGAAVSPAVKEWLETFDRMTPEENRQATKAFRSRGRPSRSLEDIHVDVTVWAETSIEISTEDSGEADSSDDWPEPRA